MPKKRDEAVSFPELHTQLRIISRLIAAQLKATTTQQDMIRLLSSTGATNAEIADVLDTTAATVNTTLQRLKKKAAKAETVAESVGDGKGNSGGSQ